MIKDEATSGPASGSPNCSGEAKAAGTERGSAPVVTSGADLIALERLRQIQAEGYVSRHDDEHNRMEMARAAASYVLNVWERSQLSESNLHNYVLAAALNVLWPWGREWWKPSDDPVRTLAKAGALIAAEIDRLNREKARHPKLATGRAERAEGRPQ